MLLEALTAAYRDACEIVASELRPTHDPAGDVERARRQLRQVPFTIDESHWRTSRSATWDPQDPHASFVRYWIADERSDRYEMWIDIADATPRLASLNQVVLAALHSQLHRPSLAHASNADNVHEHIRRERSRLLGLVNPAWAGPLGQLAITESAPFDDISSVEGLLAEHRSMVDRCIQALDGILPADAVNKALEPPWATDPADFSFNGGSKDFLAGPFLPNSWEFGYEWRERAGTFGQPASAEQLLWRAATGLIKLCTEIHVDPNMALAAVEPSWHADYKPTKMRDRSLRLH